jgi:Raf kinase inhibitor-like YbhB/YbcL family protein
MPLVDPESVRRRNKNTGPCILLSLVAVAFSGCSRDSIDDHVAMSVSVASDSFRQGGDIPPRFTCKGANISPDLYWTSLPPSTKSVALTVTDSHSIFGPYVHWVLYNQPSESGRIRENLPRGESLPNGAKQGVNSDNAIGYSGPCPSGASPHQYVFTVYALDTILTPSAPLDKTKLMAAMKGHILAAGQLMGRFHG